jgi:hypothetical protein
MHRALAIPEVLRLIMHQKKGISDRPDVLALTRVSRAFSEPALDLLWEAPPLWNLAVLMDARLCHETVVKRTEYLGGTYEALITVHSVVSVHLRAPRIAAHCPGRRFQARSTLQRLLPSTRTFSAMQSGCAGCPSPHPTPALSSTGTGTALSWRPMCLHYGRRPHTFSPSYTA